MWYNKFSRKKSEDPFCIKEGRFGELEKSSYRLAWTEDSFISTKNSYQTLGRIFNFDRVYFFSGVLVLSLIILIGRVAWLQLIKGSYYHAMAEGNRIRIEKINPKRGVIYDINGRPLVRNIANFMLYFVPADLPEDESEKNMIIKQATLLAGVDTVKILESLKLIKPKSLESYQPFFVADNIPYEKALSIYLLADDWSGVFLSNNTRREYLIGTSTISHVLGYIGKINSEELKKFGIEYSRIDYIGKSGLEYFWESELRGLSGKKHIEVDALGKEKRIISEKKAINGRNLLLAINMSAQEKLENIIATHLNKLKLKKASGVIMNPNNGEIIAMVSFPTYDNNLFAKGITREEYNKLLKDEDRPLFNRVISGEFPSGSTIKPVMAAAALEEGIINENTTFLSVGGLRIGEWFFPDWRSGGHGITNVKRAIAESINTFFYYIGGGYDNFKGLGIDKIVQYEKLFGLGSQTGIDLNGEVSGFLPTKEWKEKIKKEKWYIGDTYHISIGQGDILVTPLQVANFTAVFANGGKLFRPHIVKAILSDEDKLIREINELPIRENFIKKENIKIVREGMRQTITSGSGRSLNSLPIEVAGKTGTAQWSSDIVHTHAWFTGFAPYNDPQIVITVLVEKAGGGDVIAVPIVKEFLEWYFQNKK